MKKQSNKHPVTKDELINVLQDYPSKKDLGECFTKFHIAFSAEMDHKFQISEEKWGMRFNAFADRILTAIDPLLQELETRQQDREIGTAQMEEVKSRIGNHEKRITKLEHS